MVHVLRLISRVMIVTSCTIIYLNLLSYCMGQEDINQNVIRDAIELGNPYPILNSRNNIQSGTGNLLKRKHPNYHRRPLSNVHHSLTSLQTASSGSEEESSLGTATIDKNAVPGAANGPIEIITSKRTQNGGNHNHHHTDKAAESEECPMCAAARQNARMDDETLRALRVEIVKRQILKKLRLSEAPKMEKVPKGHSALLPPIALGNSHQSLHTNSLRSEQDDDVENLDLEDFYGKTEQIIVLPQDELPDCATWSHRTRNEAASCFIFNLPDEIRSKEIGSAELWVYKLSDAEEQNESSHASDVHHNHNFSIYEIVTRPSSSKQGTSVDFRLITARNDITENGGWVSFNITERASKWLQGKEAADHEHAIKIGCSTCSHDVNEFPFVSTGEQQPFIVFNIANGKRKKRSRRSLNCSQGITECCRESLYISFEEIEWHWVLEPKGFDAYYCKGRCHGDTALAHSATRHSNIMIDYVKSRGGVNNKTLDLVPCCTATEMSSISLLYRDPQSYNTTFQHVKLPNMVVQSCGCK